MAFCKTAIRQLRKTLLWYLLAATFLSPWSLHAQWEQTGGPKGGYCSIYGVFGSTVVASAGGNVVYSTDAGASWVVDEVLKNPTTIISLGNTLFAATNGNGILRSYDKGRSWIPANEGLVTKRINTLFASGPYLFAGADSGAFRSSNNGDNWECVSKGLPEKNRTRVLALGAKDGFLFAGMTMDGVYRSSDNGDHWSPANLGQPQYIGCRGFAVQGSNLYATLGELYMSNDNGETWIRVKHPGGASLALVKGPYLFIASSNSYQGLYRSGDGGLTWDTLTPGSRKFMASAMKADSNSLYIATSRGLYRSTDSGTSWKELSAEFKSTTVQCLASQGSTLWAGSDVLFRSTDQGATWLPMHDSPVYDIVTNRGGMFIRTPEGIVRSTDGGLKWTDANNGLGYVTDLCMIDTTLFAQRYSGVYRSTDYGASWTWANPASAGQSVGTVSAVGDVLLASYYPYALYGSTDLGNSWSLVFSNYVNRIFGADSILFLVSDRIYRSSNKGITWMPADSGFPGPSAYMVDFAATGKTFFASVSSNGMYRSTDQGLSWTPVNNGLLPLDFGALVSDGTYLYAGRSGQGVWRRSLVELLDAVTEQTDTDIPSSYRLDQNFPNPFNSATNIRFTIADEAHVTMRVFDILGREAAMLVNEHRVPGTYYSSWDATRFPSGIYFCRLQTDFVRSGHAGTYVETKKLVLIK
jgi:photosystem II stability/assembly factor-like uncharacterized protein